MIMDHPGARHPARQHLLHHARQADARGARGAHGAPTRPEEIGWPAAFYRDAVMHAREIRNRYTALDLVEDLALAEMLLKAGAKSSLELHPDAHEEL